MRVFSDLAAEHRGKSHSFARGDHNRDSRLAASLSPRGASRASPGPADRAEGGLRAPLPGAPSGAYRRAPRMVRQIRTVATLTAVTRARRSTTFSL